MSREKPQNLRDLFEQKYVSLARLPPKNDFLLNPGGEVDLSRLERLDGYTVPLINHDYGAKTPIAWNSLYERLGLNVRNIVVVANPNSSEIILDTFRSDPKYLGGGAGVGFKEKVIPYLDGGRKPEDLEAVNILVKENGRLVGYNTDGIGFVKSLEDSLGRVGKSIENSHLVILGLGGAAKQIIRLIAERKAKKISIINRTLKGDDKIGFASRVSRDYGAEVSIDGEEMTRGKLLNSFLRPDAVINLTDKGSDGALSGYSAFWMADLKYDPDASNNENISRTIAREMRNLNPDIVVADINLVGGMVSINSEEGRTGGKTTRTLAIARNEGLKNLLDGLPMVINQAAPAYVYVQNAHPDLHGVKVTEEEALKVFREAAG